MLLNGTTDVTRPYENIYFDPTADNNGSTYPAKEAPGNLVDGKFEIVTPDVKITMSPEYSYMVETKVINGRKYILIPADEGMEVNGVAVNIHDD